MGENEEKNQLIVEKTCSNLKLMLRVSTKKKDIPCKEDVSSRTKGNRLYIIT